MPGKELTHDDAARNKLERVAAYRQLQGTSHQLYLLSGRSLDEIDLPDVANVRPTDQDESRATSARPYSTPSARLVEWSGSETASALGPFPAASA